MGIFDWVEDAWDWTKGAVEDVGKGIGDVAGFIYDKVPGMDLLGDAAGVFSDIVLAPVNLTAALGNEIGKIDGLGWVGDAAQFGKKVAEEVNSNASLLHMAAYGARDARDLKNALKAKKKIENANAAIEKMNKAKDAAEKAKYAKYLVRGRGTTRTALGPSGNGVNRKAVGGKSGRAGSGMGAVRKGYK